MVETLFTQEEAEALDEETLREINSFAAKALASHSCCGKCGICKIRRICMAVTRLRVWTKEMLQQRGH
jgi:hypothetical protein